MISSIGVEADHTPFDRLDTHTKMCQYDCTAPPQYKSLHAARRQTPMTLAFGVFRRASTHGESNPPNEPYAARAANPKHRLSQLS